jgi:hypothetical protein
MATKVKLSKEEMWLEKELGADISKFDPKVQEGGKMHQDFLDDLKEFKKVWEDFNDICMQAMKTQPTKDNEKAFMLHVVAEEDHKKAREQARKGNPAAATVLLKASAKNSIELLKLMKAAKPG